MKIQLIIATILIVSVAGTNFNEFKKESNDKKNDEASHTQGSNDAADQQTRSGKIERSEGDAFPQKVRGELPKTVSHISKMSAIKNQGKCNAAYSMTITAMYEFFARKYLNKNQTFSDQDVIDCDKDNNGCLGGSPKQVVAYANSSGLSDGNKYKFVSTKQVCNKKAYPSIIRRKFRFMSGDLKGDEVYLQDVVANSGPVGVIINTNITSKGFYSYKTGVFSDKTCSSKIEDADHYVNVVGYGTDAKLGDFWVIRNNWGTTWGEKGFMRIKRGVNMCGIGNYAFGIN